MKGLLHRTPVAWLSGCLVVAAAIGFAVGGCAGSNPHQAGTLDRADYFAGKGKRLEAVAAGLRQDHGVTVHALAIDCGEPFAAETLMAELGQRTRVAVSQLGKYKTILQMVGLSMMLYRYPLFGLDVYLIGLVLTVLAAVLTLWSMVSYLRAAWPVLTAPE